MDKAPTTLGRLPLEAFGCLTLPPLAPAVLKGFADLPDLTGMVSDALDLMELPAAVPGSLLRPSLTGRRIVGPALTLHNRRRSDDAVAAVRARDNRLADIEAHNLAKPGDVLVVQGVDGVSSMGGIAAAIAKRQGEAAIIVDGMVRDIEGSRELDLPIWARGTTPLTGKWRVETIGVNVSVRIASVTVAPGDLVVADDNGICFVPHGKAAEVLARAREIAEDEGRRQQRIAEGVPLADLVKSRPALTRPLTEEWKVPAMLVEHRTYTIPHGRMAEYLERYEQFGLPVQRRHLGPLIGFYVSEIGPLNQVISIWAYASMADREVRRAALEQDADWKSFRQINSGSFVEQETRILRPAPFSPPISFE